MNGDGDIARVDIMEQGSARWAPMQHSWGGIWRVNTVKRLRAPFSVRLTSGSGKVLVARKVIPGLWRPGMTYRSNVNYAS
jgi:hypothetical protein